MRAVEANLAVLFLCYVVRMAVVMKQSATYVSQMTTSFIPIDFVCKNR